MPRSSQSLFRNTVLPTLPRRPTHNANNLADHPHWGRASWRAQHSQRRYRLVQAHIPNLERHRKLRHLRHGRLCPSLRWRTLYTMSWRAMFNSFLIAPRFYLDSTEIAPRFHRDCSHRAPNIAPDRALGRGAHCPSGPAVAAARWEAGTRAFSYSCHVAYRCADHADHCRHPS